MKKLALLALFLFPFAMIGCSNKVEPGFLMLSKDIVILDAGKDTAYVRAWYSYDWSSTNVNNDTWIQISPMSGKGSDGMKMDSAMIVFIATANTTGKSRQCIVKYQTGSMSANLMVQQKGE